MDTSTLAMLCLADGRSPNGGHTHSAGMEQAISRGIVRDLDTLRWFLWRRLVTNGPAMGFASASAARAAGDLQELARLDAALDARMLSPAARAASRSQGRGLLRLAAALVGGGAIPPVAAGAGSLTDRAGGSLADRAGGSLADRAGGSLADRAGGSLADRAGGSLAPAAPTPPPGAHWPVMFGWVSGSLGVDPDDVAGTAVHLGVAGPASAAQRLLALDPVRVAEVSFRLIPEISRITKYALQCDEMPAWSDPLTDVLAEEHASRKERFFVS